jgi:hypothetical protein
MDSSVTREERNQDFIKTEYSDKKPDGKRKRKMLQTDLDLHLQNEACEKV